MKHNDHRIYLKARKNPSNSSFQCLNSIRLRKTPGINLHNIPIIIEQKSIFRIISGIEFSDPEIPLVTISIISMSTEQKLIFLFHLLGHIRCTIAVFQLSYIGIELNNMKSSWYHISALPLLFNEMPIFRNMWAIFDVQFQFSKILYRNWITESQATQYIYFIKFWNVPPMIIRITVSLRLSLRLIIFKKNSKKGPTWWTWVCLLSRMINPIHTKLI